MARWGRGRINYFDDVVFYPQYGCLTDKVYYCAYSNPPRKCWRVLIFCLGDLAVSALFYGRGKAEVLSIARKMQAPTAAQQTT